MKNTLSGVYSQALAPLPSSPGHVLGEAEEVGVDGGAAGDGAGAGQLQGASVALADDAARLLHQEPAAGQAPRLQSGLEIEGDAAMGHPAADAGDIVVATALTGLDSNREEKADNSICSSS